MFSFQLETQHICKRLGACSYTSQTIFDKLDIFSHTWVPRSKPHKAIFEPSSYVILTVQTVLLLLKENPFFGPELCLPLDLKMQNQVV